MGDGPKVFFGGGAGPNQLRRTAELEPYDSDYFTADLHLGLEPGDSFPFLFIPYIPQEIVRWNVLVDLDYNYLGGDEKNYGSHRHQLLARVGLRTRFASFEHFAALIDARIGGGWAMNRLNFGKGVPLTTEHSATVQWSISAGVQLCLNRHACFQPQFTFLQEFGETSEAYENTAFLFGIEVGGDPDFDREKPEREEEPPDDSACRKRLAEAEEGRDAAQRELGKCTERAADLREQLGDRTKEAETLRTEIATLRAAADRKKPIEHQYATLDIPRAILFGNDNPDIPLQPQWFADVGPNLYACRSNPDLDHIIRTLRRWATQITALQHIKRLDSADQYQFILRVKGYANDSGPSDRNRRLALGRSSSVIDYVTKTGPMATYLAAVDPADFARRKGELLVNGGIDLERRHTCGAQDATGKRQRTLADLLPLDATPAEQRKPLRVINENVLHPNDPIDDIRADFGAYVDMSQPVFRLARLEVDMTKNGHLLSPQERRELMQLIEPGGTSPAGK